jgi:predicted RNase H-like nuclease
MRYLGLDLAWGPRNRTGVAELDDDGRLMRSASVLTDDEIRGFVAEAERATGLVAAIDAPLVVVNEAGQRPCETAVGRAFGRYGASAHTANLRNPHFRPEPRGARLARKLGWDIDPERRPAPSRSCAIEVYPHPAMVALFALPTIVPYKRKRGRSLELRRQAFSHLCDLMEQWLDDPLQIRHHERWTAVRADIRSARYHSELKRTEDEIDAIFCAYLAWLWDRRPAELQVMGSLETGYIVVPMTPT